jgi:hypothetical protein
MVIGPGQWAEWLDPDLQDPAELAHLLAPAVGSGLITPGSPPRSTRSATTDPSSSTVPATTRPWLRRGAACPRGRARQPGHHPVLSPLGVLAGAGTAWLCVFLGKEAGSVDAVIAASGWRAAGFLDRSISVRAARTRGTAWPQVPAGPGRRGCAPVRPSGPTPCWTPHAVSGPGDGGPRPDQQGHVRVCADCNRSGPRAAREAKPDAARCVPCQAKHDRRRRCRAGYASVQSPQPPPTAKTTAGAARVQ